MNKKELILVLILLIIGVSLFFLQKERPLNVAEKTRIEQENIQSVNTFEDCIANGGENQTPNYNAPRVCVLNNKAYEEKCVDSDKYFVITEPAPNYVGSDIIIKYKSFSNQNFSCQYIKEQSDLEILNNEFANFVVAIEGDYLIIDSGTAPDPRRLSVYDLIKRKKIFEDSYSRPVEIKNNIINYWTESSIKATEANCPELKEYLGYGGQAAIDVYVSLNLSTIAKKELGKTKCSYRP